MSCVFAFTAAALLLAIIMRRQFLLWAALRGCLLGIMALSFPPAGQFVFGSVHSCLIVRIIASDIALGVIGPLLATYIEPEIRLPNVRRALWMMFPIGLGVSALAPSIAFHGELDWLHDAILLALVLTLATALVIAIRAGSRIAGFQAAAWAPGIAIGMMALGWELTVDSTMPFYFQAMLVAVLNEFVITAAGIGYGFSHAERQRDKAIEDVRVATEASTQDPLTGIANRRGLMRYYRDQECNRPAGVAIVDCDHFKRINDSFGHDIGDQVLIAVAEALSIDNCFAGRLGGEEFMLLIHGEKWQRTAEIARRRIAIHVRKKVPQIPFPVTASAGLAATVEGESLAMAIKRADRALYAAKNAGRDRSLALTEFELWNAAKSTA